MSTKSVAKEAQEIQLASDMIVLGARLQVLQAETSLSYDRLARLYREIRGCSPPKGMLPFSVDWFMTWLPNIHSSLFYSVFRYLEKHAQCERPQALIQAYRLYLEQSEAGRIDSSEEPVLSFTRAWMLLRFFDSGMVQLSCCERCSGAFVSHAHDPHVGFICAICRPPPRAGKTRKTSRAKPSPRNELPPKEAKQLKKSGSGAMPVESVPVLAALPSSKAEV